MVQVDPQSIPAGDEDTLPAAGAGHLDRELESREHRDGMGLDRADAYGSVAKLAIFVPAPALRAPDEVSAHVNSRPRVTDMIGVSEATRVGVKRSTSEPSPSSPLAFAPPALESTLD
jgi:hypothetical protein